MGIGGVQLGLMYVFYYQSFELLTVPEVLIFTIFTPIYVTLIHDVYQKRFSGNYLLTAALAVGGTAVIRWGSISTDFWLGFLVIQASNLCFAFGQVSYKRLKKEPDESVVQDFAFFYIGAWIVASAALFLLGKPQYPQEAVQWWVLIWLGLVASGLAVFPLEPRRSQSQRRSTGNHEQRTRSGRFTRKYPHLEQRSRCPAAGARFIYLTCFAVAEP